MSRMCLFDTMEEAIIKFAGGNPGAIQTLVELLKFNPDGMFQNLLTLDRMELYESKIYMLWNDCCDRKIEKVQKIIKLYRSGKIKQSDIEERVKTVGYGKNFDDFLEGCTNENMS